MTGVSPTSKDPDVERLVLLGAAVVFLTLCAVSTGTGQQALAAVFGLLGMTSSIVGVLAPRIRHLAATTRGIDITTEQPPKQEEPATGPNGWRRAVVAGGVLVLIALGGAAAAGRGRSQAGSRSDRSAVSSSLTTSLVSSVATTDAILIDPRTWSAADSWWNVDGPAVDPAGATESLLQRWSRVRGSDTGRFTYSFYMRSEPSRPATFTARLASDAPPAGPSLGGAAGGFTSWASDVVLIVNGHVSRSIRVNPTPSALVGGSVYVWDVSADQFRKGDNRLSLAVGDEAAHRNGLSIYFSADRQGVVDAPRIEFPSPPAALQGTAEIGPTSGERTTQVSTPDSQATEERRLPTTATGRGVGPAGRSFDASALPWAGHGHTFALDLIVVRPLRLGSGGYPELTTGPPGLSRRH